MLNKDSQPLTLDRHFLNQLTQTRLIVKCIVPTILNFRTGMHSDNFILMCNHLGVPLAPEETVGPATVLQFA